MPIVTAALICIQSDLSKQLSTCIPPPVSERMLINRVEFTAEVNVWRESSCVERCAITYPGGTTSTFGRARLVWVTDISAVKALEGAARLDLKGLQIVSVAADRGWRRGRTPAPLEDEGCGTLAPSCPR